MNNLMSSYQSQLEIPPPYMSNKVFTHVLQKLAAVKYDTDLTLAILNDFFNGHRLIPTDFPEIKGSYSRTILLQEKTGFQIMMARWDKGAASPIHGHPGYSLLYVLEGHLNERFYLREEKRLMEISILNYTPGDYSYHNGERGRFDNAIHQLSAAKPSLSLHIYSDDASRGEIYTRS